MMTSKREVEVFKDEHWISIDFKDLRKGDLFRLYDNKVLVEDGFGHTEFITDSDPYPDPDFGWVLTINII